MSRPLRARIHLPALRHNLERVRQLAPGCRVMAVVKADAYGHGLGAVAGALADAGAFGVTTLEEAAVVRTALPGARVILLEGFFHRDELSPIRAQGFEPVVHQPRQVADLENLPDGAPVRVWLKVNSGMNRLGFAPADVPVMYQRLRDARSVVGEMGLMTHLACADDLDDAMSQRQLGRFRAAVDGLEGERSVANSAGIVGWPEARQGWVRPGIMLYGVCPVQGSSATRLGLNPVMAVESQLIEVHTCRKGESVGYGADFVCPETMPVGVAAVGYGDGYPRHAPNGTPVLVNGQRVPLAGRVSMDMITVDLRSQPAARIGDPVVLWGRGLPVEEVAGHAGTIAYELLCGIAPRVPREYHR